MGEAGVGTSQGRDGTRQGGEGIKEEEGRGTSRLENLEGSGLEVNRR